MNRVSFPHSRSVGLLLDPDKSTDTSLRRILSVAGESGTDYILAGGSITFRSIDPLIEQIRKYCSIPVVLFPGSLLQLTLKADIIMLLSLISGRNPELLIGNHITAAPFLKNVKEKLVSTGYILVSCGNRTSVEYMSQTEAIPADKQEIVVATALAGEMLGMAAIYLEAGSGAANHIPSGIIKAVRENVSIPLIVGGGIRTAEEVETIYRAGADTIILGNSCEKNPGLLSEACAVRNKYGRMPASPGKSPE